MEVHWGWLVVQRVAEAAPFDLSVARTPLPKAEYKVGGPVLVGHAVERTSEAVLFDPQVAQTPLQCSQHWEQKRKLSPSPVHGTGLQRCSSTIAPGTQQE